MAGYHISVAAQALKSFTLVTMRVNTTVFYIHTNATIAAVHKMADDIGLAKYVSHRMDGLDEGDTVVCESDDELFLLFFGLAANRRKRAA